MTSVARLQENAPLNAPSSAACAERPGFAASMRQSAHVVTLPYRAPELICASCQFQSAARLPVSREAVAAAGVLAAVSQQNFIHNFIFCLSGRRSRACPPP